MRPRRNRPLFIIDIAMPRDVEAGGRRNRAGVPLQHRRPAGDRAREPGAARQRGRARRSDRRRGGREVRRAGCARAARFRPSSRCAQRFEAIRRAELERLDFKLSALPPEARARVDEITHLIVEKLLLTPTEQLKALGDSETVGAYAEALTRLFALADSTADDRPSATGRASARPARRAVHPPRQARGAALTRVPRSRASPRHARQPARAVAGQHRRRAHRRSRRPALPHRRHQDLRRSAAGRAAVGSRRQAAVRQGNRGRAARRRDRPRRAQQQGHAGGAARRADDRRRAAARGSARCGRAAGPAEAGAQRRRQSARRDRRARRRARASRRRSAPAACGASRS